MQGASPPRGACSRRAFLGTAGGAVLGLSACDTPPIEDGEAIPDTASISRPLLRPWADDIVWMSAGTQELPVAYVSMAQRQVFVDHKYRDRATGLLRAHISVSTALWRIPLPGDPVGQAVAPGDALREFEEMSMRQWDPSMRPEMDDIRIMRGSAGLRRVDFSCVAMVGGGDEAWLTAGPWSVSVSDGHGTGETTREDFRVIGTGLRYTERECSRNGDAVQLVRWAAEP
jgi:hypothetical protein